MRVHNLDVLPDMIHMQILSIVNIWLTEKVLYLVKNVSYYSG